MYENRTYAIVDTVTWQEGLSASGASLDYLFTKILETSPETIRYSVCGDAFIVKSDNQTNIAELTSFATTYGIEYTLYTYDEILQVVSTSAWQVPTQMG